MSELYDRVRRFGDEVYDRSRGAFLAERLAFGQQMELILEPLESAVPSWHHDRIKSCVMILLSRMFNDFEAAQQLILRGLPEQAVNAMRDGIECMMVIRLFEAEPKTALRWMNDLKQYSAGNCKALLDEREIECPEYAFYSSMSQLAHPNIFSSVAHVDEVETEKGVIWTYRFGGMWHHRWLQLAFHNLLCVVQLALVALLPPLYAPAMEDPLGWWHRVGDLVTTLEQLGVEIEGQRPDTSAADPRILQKLGRPIRIHSRLLPELHQDIKLSTGLGLRKRRRRADPGPRP